MIDISTYNACETRGRVGLSVRALHVGAPVTFDFVGYPHRVYQEAELLTCVDLFGGGPRGNNLREFYLNGFALSRDEVELVSEIGDRVVELTREQYGRGLRPWVGPLNYMRIWRAISYLSNLLQRKLVIFEVGGGAGYLGCIAARLGHKYVSTDIAQNMYLWQNRLYTSFVGDKLQELATAEPGKSLQLDVNARIIHIPWWHYASFYRFSPPFRADIVVSERNLGEMTPEGLEFTFAVARDVLAGAKGVVGTRQGQGVFAFTAIGSGHMSNFAQVGMAAARFGFRPILEEEIVLLAHQDTDVGSYAISEAYPSDPSDRILPSHLHPFQSFDWRRDYHSPSGRTDTVRASDELPLKWSEAATGYAWLNYLDFLEGIPIAE